MKTLLIQIEDGFMEQFMDFVKKSHSNITISNVQNLKNDPYFYSRQKELHQIREDIKNGKSDLISFEDFEHRVNILEKELEVRYAH